jgi:hypothetical protein
MKLNTMRALALVAVVVLLAACGKKGPDYTRYIPKESGYVVAIDIKSMMAKLEQDSLQVENLLEVLKDTAKSSDYSQALDMWKQFKDAGLDFENKVLFAVPSIDMGKGSVAMQVVAGLKDAKKLEEFVSKLPNSPKVEKEKSLNYVSTPDFAVGWNKDAVMIVGSASDNSVSIPGVDTDTTMQRPSLGNAASSLDLVKKYFALGSSESIASVSGFADLLGKKADVAVFTNSSSMAGSSANMVLAMMPKVKELLEGVYSTTIINFEEGKAVFTSDTYAGKSLAALLKKYAGPTVDMSLVEPYASQNVNVVAAFSFKPELIPALLKETGTNDLVNMGLQSGGLTADDVVKAFKGDFAVLVSDFTMETKTNDLGLGKDATYTSWQPAARLLVAMRIGDKAAFEKLVNLGVKEGLVKREGNRLMLQSPADSGMTIGIENDLLVVSSRKDVYEGYVAKKGNISLDGNAKDMLRKSSFGMYFDAEKMLKAIPAAMFDSTDTHQKAILDRSANTFKSLWFNTGNFDGKKLTGSGELVMSGKKNALPQLVRYLMYVGTEMKASEAEKEMMETEVDWD